MSGPVLLSFTGDIFGGPAVNNVLLNGSIGEFALYVTPPVDSVIFPLIIGGRLKAKESLCARGNAPPLKVPKPQNYPVVCDKVKP